MALNRMTAFVTFALLLSLSGCAGKEEARTQVRGTVSYKGTPVAGKTLILAFDSSAGEFFSHTLPLSSEGTFSGEVSKAGSYKVVVMESMAVMEGIEKPNPKSLKIPAKYRDAKSSDIAITIPTAKNDFTIELKD